MAELGLQETLAADACGVEWVVDAYGCDAAALTDPGVLRALLERVLAQMRLNVAAPPVWHQFAGPAGVTALYLLQESHLACHTYPEANFASFNLYCCRPRPPWPWAEVLRQVLTARRVTVRCLPRGDGA